MILKVLKFKYNYDTFLDEYIICLNDEMYGLNDLRQSDFYMLKNSKRSKQILSENFEEIFSLSVSFKILTKINLKLVQASLKKNFPEYFV